MVKIIFFEENPRFPKLHGRGKKPSHYIIKIQHQHENGKVVDRVLDYAKTNAELKAKLRTFIKEKNAEVDELTHSLLAGKKAASNAPAAMAEA